MVRRLLRQFFPPGLPGQFWLMVGGSLLTSTGFTMAFPFLTLYLSTQLGVPMDRVGLLFIANAAAGIAAQGIAGPVADQFGRKPVMLTGLFAQAIIALGFTQARAFEEFVLLATVNGFFGATFHPASHAMVVDLVEPRRRAEAFGIMRIAANLGWVIGPALGGLLAIRSYSFLFLGTALAQFIYLAFVLMVVRETLPKSPRVASWRPANSGYGAVFRDRTFVIFLGASTLLTLVYTQMTTTMPVYLKTQAGVPESGYGMLMALNAGMVVLLQIPTTRLVENRNRACMLALGALLYGAGFGSLGLWRDLPLFALSMAVLTVGEMVIAPVASALVADLSPEETRARYMAAFGLTWTIGFGLGPAWGGFVLERSGPSWLWGLALVGACLSALAFMPLRNTSRRHTL